MMTPRSILLIAVSARRKSHVRKRIPIPAAVVQRPMIATILGPVIFWSNFLPLLPLAAKSTIGSKCGYAIADVKQWKNTGLQRALLVYADAFADVKQWKSMIYAGLGLVLAVIPWTNDAQIAKTYGMMSFSFTFLMVIARCANLILICPLNICVMAAAYIMPAPIQAVKALMATSTSSVLHVNVRILSYAAMNLNLCLIVHNHENK